MGVHNPGGFTYGLSDLARRCGTEGHKPDWQQRYLTGLIRDYGFPPPIPAMIGDRFVADVVARSRWPVASVDAWFADRDPPAAAAADREQQRAAADTLDDRAAAIGLRLVAA